MTRNLKRYYANIMDDLGQDTDERYLEYVKEKPRTFIYENLVFDVESLDSYYNCRGCKQKNPRAFCCSGYDLELTRRDREVIERFLPELQSDYPRLGRLQGGAKFWRYGDEFEKVMQRKARGDCVFLMPGAKGCYLHAFALERGLDPLDVKPYICSLYPLVVVIIGDTVVVSTLNKKSRIILEAGDEAIPCTTRRGRKEDHALVRSREILVRMFGEKTYGKLIRQVRP